MYLNYTLKPNSRLDGERKQERIDHNERRNNVNSTRAKFKVSERKMFRTWYLFRLLSYSRACRYLSPIDKSICQYLFVSRIKILWLPDTQITFRGCRVHFVLFAKRDQQAYWRTFFVITDHDYLRQQHKKITFLFARRNFKIFPIETELINFSTRTLESQM